MPHSGPADSSDPMADLALIGMGAVIACGLVVWAGASLAAVLRHGVGLGAPVATSFGSLLRLPKYFGHPAMAWPEPARSRLPGPLLYWTCTMVVTAVGVGLALGVWRIFRGSRETLDRRTRLGVPAQARLARPRDLAPLIVRRPVAGRFLLGRVGHHLLATENRRSEVGRRARARRGDVGAVGLIGPSRSGKTRTAIAGANAWQGPAVLSSVKTDLLGATLDARSDMGEIKIFDPANMTGWGSASWTPLRGAQTLRGAQAAAKALVDAAPRSEHDSSTYWLKQAEILLAALQWLAANVKELTMSDVVDWVLGQDRPTETQTGTVAPLLRALIDDEDESLACDARRVHTWLKGIWEMDPRTASSIYATARTAIWPWADPGVAAVAATCEIDLGWLLSGKNTLYICAPLADQDRLAPALGGLIGDLINQAFERSVRSGLPLDPALLLVLDEAANTPLRKLPEWASTVAGIGVQLVTVWQSKSQLHAVYGTQAETILTNHLTKMFFAGMSDASGLDYVSHLAGTEHVVGALHKEAGEHTPAPAHVPLVAPNVLRQIKPREALLVHGTLPPAHVKPLALRDPLIQPRRT